MKENFDNTSEDNKMISEEERNLQSLLIDNIKNRNQTTTANVNLSNHSGDLKKPRKRTNHNATQNSISNEQQNKRFKWGCLLSILLFILIAVGGGIGYYYYQQEQEFENERKKFAVLTDDNYNRRDYEDFIREFPESQYRKTVEGKLAKLQDMYDDWDMVKETQNISALEAFCLKYNLPECELYILAKERIELLHWKTAKGKNTIEAFETYLTQHPDGNHAIEATNEIDRLKKEEEERLRMEEEKRVQEEELERLRQDSIEKANTPIKRGLDMLDKWF